MLNKEERDIIRHMIYVIAACSIKGLSISSGVIVADSYINSLCIINYKLSWRNYIRYRKIINKLNSNSIISFKG